MKVYNNFWALYYKLLKIELNIKFSKTIHSKYYFVLIIYLNQT